MYKTITLPVVLYDCETWPVILREEHRLRMFEKRVLRRTFGLMRDVVTGGWRSTLKIIQVKVDEIGRACSMNGYKKKWI
jgi:hypothetical protein